MKILFVYPNVTRQRSPQLGICMLAAVARRLGHECAVYDLTVIRAGREVPAFQAKLEEFRPNLLAVSCRSNEWTFLESLFGSVDTGQALKVFGGPHVTVAPEEAITLADIITLGEGELVFEEILKRVAAGTELTDIPGCWVKTDTRIVKNEMPSLISDLDQLPFPYWGILDTVHYHDSYVKGLFENATAVGTFEASRGCPYNCSYCTNDYVRTLYTGKGKWRREKSPERIVQEITRFREEYGLDGVYWIDEIILTNSKRLREFCDSYTSKVDVPFVFMERPENMTDEKVAIIKRAGATQVMIGIESGDENLRRSTLSRRHTQETIVSAFQTARSHDLKTHAFTMVGFPGQDRQSYRKTYQLSSRRGLI